jgi:hypothetical protein
MNKEELVKQIEKAGKDIIKEENKISKEEIKSIKNEK